MKRINVMVSDDAHLHLQEYKRKKGFRSLDEALDDHLTKKYDFRNE
jgi:hypothetical protein